MGSDVKDRLRQAALALFREHGYERATSAGIAAQAGVTERTFFRHFADKREVLFDGEAILRTAMAASIADAPEDLSPVDTLFRAFRSVLPILERNRPYSQPRQRIIAGTPALAERELAKHAALADALAAALKARGVEDLRAVLAARTGMAAFVHATNAWLDEPELTLPLRSRLDLAYQGLKTIMTEIGADRGDAA